MPRMQDVGLPVDGRSEARQRRPTDWAAVLLLLGVAAWHFLTLPSCFYSGDNFACRAETANWLMSGHLGIDYALEAVMGGTRQQRAGMLEQRGQYFFENDKRGRFYSKYGIGYTFLYLPPLWVQKLIVGRVELMDSSRAQIFLLGVYLIFFALAVIAYLYAIAGLYTDRKRTRVTFVLILVYCTFVWHYLRAPTLEIFQMFPFLGFYYHMIRFMRGQRAPGPEGAGAWRNWKHMLFATLCVGGLLFLKTFFGLLIAIGGVFALFAGPREEPLFVRAITNLRRNFWRYAVLMALPIAACLGLIFWSNSIRFGDWLNMGYGQWVGEDGLSHDRFCFEFVPKAFAGFFFSKGNTNAFAHFPVFVAAMAGLRRFGRKHSEELVLIGVIFVVNLVAMSGFYFWSGEWCYGPRYLLHILILGSIPFLTTLDRLPAAANPWIRRTAVGVMVVAFGWSFQMQICVNSFDYFVCHRVTPLLGELKQDRINDYTARTCGFHRGYLCKDLLAYRDGGKEFYPLKVLEEIVPADRRGFIQRIEAYVKFCARPNFFFADK
ncbi:MAG: hypothetical protein QME60_02420 [Verrucomicrobiota bacterium]|nr:hypothetical protein [Verrucomicrobiota bacterium]